MTPSSYEELTSAEKAFLSSPIGWPIPINDPRLHAWIFSFQPISTPTQQQPTLQKLNKRESA